MNGKEEKCILAFGISYSIFGYDFVQSVVAFALDLRRFYVDTMC